GSAHEPKNRPGIVVKMWQVPGERDAKGIDDRRFIWTRLCMGETEANPAKPDESGDCQESRQPPEGWAAELRPDHERKRAPPAIECIRERILASDPKRFQLRSRACACRFPFPRADPGRSTS